MIRAISRLFRGARDASVASQEPLALVDVEAAATQLDVERLATSDGRSNIPSDTATSLSAAEATIALYFEEEAQSKGAKVAHQLEVLRQRLEGTSIESQADEVRNTLPRFKSCLDPVIATHRASLSDLKRHERALFDEFNTFKRENGITRSPRYPESKLFHVAIILVILVIEAIMNGYFFAQGSEFGLVGGVSQAVITASINILIALIFGRAVIPQLFHRKVWRKGIGVLLGIVFIVAIPTYNLLVAHYRDALAGAVANASNGLFNIGADVFQRLVADPFGLQNFDSWLLFLLGILFAIIAAFDGFSFDDPYPGFGGLHRRLETARDDYQHEKSALLDELSSLRDEALRSLSATEDRMRLRQKELQDFVTIARNRRRQFETYFRDLDSKLNNLLIRYRDTNRRYREAPAPRYFETRYDLADKVEISLPSIDDSARVAVQVDAANGVRRTIREAENQVRRYHMKQLEKLGEEFDKLER